MRNNFKGFLSQQQKVFIVANGLDCNSDFWIMGEPDDELNKITKLSDITPPNNDVQFKKCPICQSEMRMFIEPASKKKYGYRLRCTNPECDMFNGINKLHSYEEEAANIWNNGLWRFDDE